MPYTIEHDEALGIIELKTEPTLSESEFHESVTEILKTCNRTGVRRVLADTSVLATPPRSLDVFLAFSNFPRDVKHALVIPKSGVRASEVRFVDNMAAHRGFATRTFDSRNRALQWLLED